MAGQPSESLGEGAGVFAHPQRVGGVGGTCRCEVLHGLVGGRIGHLTQHFNVHGIDHGGSQDDFDHRMGRQGPVELVELLAAGGGDGEGDAQVVALFAVAQLDGAGVKAGVELLGNMSHGMYKTLYLGAHHFDGKAAGVLDQGLLTGAARGRWGCRHGVIIPFWGIWHSSIWVITYNDGLCRVAWM